MDEVAEYTRRIKAVQGVLSDKGIDWLTVSGEKNMRYLFGVETGRGVISAGSSTLWVRGVYEGVYERFFEKAPYRVRTYRPGAIESYFKRVKPDVVGFEDVSYSTLKHLKKKLGVKRARIVDVVETLRMIKSPYELRLLRQSARMAKKGMETAFKAVREGVPELYAVAEIEAAIRREGSESPPFESGMICAAGVHGADIHAHPSKRRIKRGLVVVDLGARYRGYHSDMTRTLPVGRLTKKEKEVSEAVENIKDEVIDSLTVGGKIADVHGLADEKIKSLGYEFHHLIGHGVGLEIHEKPSISPESKLVLKEGMVFTIEPGIYLPGRFGARFEDTIHLAKNGPVNLTRM
ncbi:MAG: Xaa-Pro peptidase family protein [Candidatus Altiarchaeota archaeon]